MSNNDLNKDIYDELCKVFDKQWHKFGECPQCIIDEVSEGVEYAEDFDKNAKNREQYKRMASIYAKKISVSSGSFKCSFCVNELPYLMRKFRSLSRIGTKHKIPEVKSRFCDI